MHFAIEPAGHDDKGHPVYEVRGSFLVVAALDLIATFPQGEIGQ